MLNEKDNKKAKDESSSLYRSNFCWCIGRRDCLPKKQKNEVCGRRHVSARRDSLSHTLIAFYNAAEALKALRYGEGHIIINAWTE